MNISKERFEFQSAQSIEEAKSRCETAATLEEVEEIVKETFPEGFYMNARGEIALEDDGMERLNTSQSQKIKCS